MKKALHLIFITTIIFILTISLYSVGLAVSVTIVDDNGNVISETETDVIVDGESTIAKSTRDVSARNQFINDIINLGKQKFEEANGRAKRAHYSGDIYVCKNFTVYLFNENAEKYRMATYPDQKLIIPDNKPKKEMVEYAYGVEWKDIPASEGNPFEVAASFRYDESKSKEENWEIAREFLKNVKKGDYFQMTAKYYYGIGAHSMIFIEDYQEETDSVHWMDSNMKGEKRNGERYGYVQFDAVKEIDWFVEAFCRRKYGATIYRLSDDIVYAR